MRHWPQAVQPRPRLLRGKSNVAAIVDPYGGVRTVVARPGDMRANVRPDELCLVIPNWRVREPLPWGAIPFVIRQSFNYLDWWIGSGRNDLGPWEEHIAMYRLRKLELNRRTLDLDSIVTT